MPNPYSRIVRERVPNPYSRVVRERVPNPYSRIVRGVPTVLRNSSVQLTNA